VGISEPARGPSQINLWSADTGEVLHKFEKIPGVFSAEFSPDGSRILLGAADGNAYLFDAKTYVEIARFGGHDGPVTAVAFHPTGATIATGCTDGVIRYFRVPISAK
jgi:WD40 repeat protein